MMTSDLNARRQVRLRVVDTAVLESVLVGIPTEEPLDHRHERIAVEIEQIDDLGGVAGDRRRHGRDRRCVCRRPHLLKERCSRRGVGVERFLVRVGDTAVRVP